jgi:hypothetical protein
MKNVNIYCLINLIADKSCLGETGPHIVKQQFLNIFPLEYGLTDPDPFLDEKDSLISSLVV